MLVTNGFASFINDNLYNHVIWVELGGQYPWNHGFRFD